MRLLLLCVLGCAASLVNARQINNYDMSAVPAPGTVIIDGNLQEWDRTAGVTMAYDNEAMVDIYSAKVYMMYDARNLYIALDIKDPTPEINSVDPIQRPGEAWMQDSVKLHFWTDREKSYSSGDLITNISSYFYSTKEKPVCFIDHVDYTKVLPGRGNVARNALGAGVDVAFMKHEDGRGYTQEMRISHENLMRFGRGIEEGKDLRCGVEIFWGDEANPSFYKYTLSDLINRDNPRRKFFYKNKRAWGQVVFSEEGYLPSKPVEIVESIDTKFTKLLYSTDGPVELTYTLPHDAHVTLVVETLDGKRIRNLISDYPRQQGVNTDYWDGKDDAGNLVSDGAFRFRGVYHKGMALNYHFSLKQGVDKGPWLAGVQAPLDVESDRETVYISSEADKNALVALDYAGNQRWINKELQGGLLARGDRYLYMISDQIRRDKGIYISRINPENGSVVVGKDGGDTYKVLGEYSMKYGKQGLHKDNVMGFAYAYGRLWVSLYFDEKLIALDAETMEVLKEYELKRPTGLGVNRDGELHAITDRDVVLIHDDGHVEDIIEVGLREPIAITFDAVGNIYVSDWRNLMFVKVFSPNGTLINKVGRPGGRPDIGSYDRLGMRYPRGLSIDYERRLWVTENTVNPKRVSVWSERSPFLKEFIALEDNPKVDSFIDLEDPRTAYLSSHRVRLNWETGDWFVDMKFTDDKYRGFKPDSYYHKYSNLNMNGDPMEFRDEKTNILWTYPNNFSDDDDYKKVVLAKRGVIRSPKHVIGEAVVAGKQIFCISGKAGQAFLMTRDGLYISAIFKDYRDAPKFMRPDMLKGTPVTEMTCGQNWRAGQFFRNSADGNVYITDNKNGIMVTRISGLETLADIDPGTIVFNKALLMEAEKKTVRKTATPVKNLNSIMVPRAKAIQEGDSWIDKYYWDENYVAEFGLEDGRSVKASLVYDERNLNICFKVNDPSPMLNSFSNYRTLFKTGDVVVCDLRTKDSTGDAIEAGDIRLLFTEKDGKPTVVMFNYKVKGTRFPIIFTSSGGMQRIDTIKELSDVEVDFTKMAGSYVMNAVVPLESIGFGPGYGDRYKADLGVLFSDAKGEGNDGYVFWSGKKSEGKSDLVELINITPMSWGKFIIE